LNGNELVSIIIPTYNSAHSIKSCLESIKKQSYGAIEVIVIDNFSSDHTRSIAKEFDVTIIKKNSERATARNIGIQHAKGIYILSLDSDMELNIDVIHECVNIMKTCPKAGGIIIPEISVGKSFWVAVRNFERSFYADTTIESARFFKKDIVENVSGYEENIVFFEESTLPQKIERKGYRTDLRIQSQIIHHEETFNFFKWLQKKYYYAQRMGLYKEQYGQYASSQISPFYRITIFINHRNFKRFLSHPILAFGIVWLKTFEFLFSAFGYFLKNRGDE